ncbi:CoA-transferase [Oceanicola sp. 502str15]|uniref:CoA-transferase n=1 Tax=Oceanicola sp. 502str15 TaxID=2696061 RepID=UPI0020940EA8|nr:CoA-transferase [Oceanicola sp. 502str15]MCO6383438.1 acyl CoA:acetate/3-ketoacid CoA transferase [Oceanicola sp. 502str15]
MPPPLVATAKEIAAEVADGATVAIVGAGGGLLEPDAILAAIEARFLATGHPRDLTVLHAQGIGDRDARGLNRLAHAGLVKRVIGSHWVWSPRMQALATSGQIEAYAVPGGVLSLLLRETGAGRPGLWTRVGLGTFVDPRHGGGALNARATTPLCELRTAEGEDWLFFPRLPVDVAILRGTVSDTKGNITFDREPAELDSYALALAAHNCGGRVLAQVQELSPAPILPARRVRLPAALVNRVLVVPDQPQTHARVYDPRCSGEAIDREAVEAAAPDLARAIAARRALAELPEGATACFGFGIPDAVAAEISRRGEADRYRMIIDHGVHGGRLLSGALFGVASGPEAIISATDQADFIHGGAIDVAFLGFGEIDAAGNVNASALGGNPVGPGAFMDIAQSCRKLVLCGTFEASGLKCRVEAGQLVIDQPGRFGKFVGEVAQVTWPGWWPEAAGQEVVVVTERASFALCGGRLVLRDIAPGIELQRDILSRMGFAPEVPQRPGLYPARMLATEVPLAAPPA